MHLHLNQLALEAEVGESQATVGCVYFAGSLALSTEPAAPEIFVQ